MQSAQIIPVRADAPFPWCMHRRSAAMQDLVSAKNCSFGAMAVETVLYFGLFAFSLFVLIKASDWFVDSAEAIGLSLGISPFIIGVTIVAFGTSLPELASSIAAVFANDSGIVVGNVVGSNITNILLVIGVSAFVAKKIELDYDIMNVDMPYLLGSAFLLWFVLQDLTLSVFEAILFLVALVLFLVHSIRGKEKEIAKHPKATPRAYILLVVGAVLVYLGAHFTIESIQKISESLNVPSEIIALTGVALGTSLPEVVVSVTAAKKGKPAIAVGNVLGSNLFNTYAVMGIPSLIQQLTIPESFLTFGLPFMIAVTVIFAMTCLSGKINRWEGAMLILIYVYFVVESFLIESI